MFEFRGKGLRTLALTVVWGAVAASTFFAISEAISPEFFALNLLPLFVFGWLASFLVLTKKKRD